MTTLTNSQSYPGSTAISQSPAVSHTTFRLKDPASAITHFIGMVAAVSAAPFLLERAAQTGHIKSIVSSLLFIISMILLYGASTFYHAVITNDRATLLLKKAGSYHDLLFDCRKLHSGLYAGSAIVYRYTFMPDRLGTCSGRFIPYGGLG